LWETFSNRASPSRVAVSPARPKAPPCPQRSRQPDVRAAGAAAGAGGRGRSGASGGAGGSRRRPAGAGWGRRSSRPAGLGWRRRRWRRCSYRATRTAVGRLRRPERRPTAPAAVAATPTATPPRDRCRGPAAGACRRAGLSRCCSPVGSALVVVAAAAAAAAGAHGLAALAGCQRNWIACDTVARFGAAARVGAATGSLVAGCSSWAAAVLGSSAGGSRATHAADSQSAIATVAAAAAAASAPATPDGPDSDAAGR